MQEVRVVMQVVLRHDDVLAQLLQLQHRLAVCEKALNDYLETKRLAFPRFYFISAADLLDILSNGNNPQVIDRHLIKLFDSILRLQYETNTPNALGMHSKENDEYVPFVSFDPDQPAFIVCGGRVELWLRAIIQQMRSTLHELFLARPARFWGEAAGTLALRLARPGGAVLQPNQLDGGREPILWLHGGGLRGCNERAAQATDCPAECLN